MDPDPDPGGPKTRGSGGSGSATLLFNREKPRGFPNQISKSIGQLTLNITSLEFIFMHAVFFYGNYHARMF
jgi:hypothetical protein